MIHLAATRRAVFVTTTHTHTHTESRVSLLDTVVLNMTTIGLLHA